MLPGRLQRERAPQVRRSIDSLYPLMTVALARGILKERVRRVQEVGIAIALAGVILMSI